MLGAEHHARLALGDEIVREPPRHLVCPICCELMTDPVMAEDEHTYCRTCIQSWFSRSQTSPITQAQIVNTHMLLTNRPIKALIVEFREQQQQGRERHITQMRQDFSSDPLSEAVKQECSVLRARIQLLEQAQVEANKLLKLRNDHLALKEQEHALIRRDLALRDQKEWALLRDLQLMRQEAAARDAKEAALMERLRLYETELRRGGSAAPLPAGNLRPMTSAAPGPAPPASGATRLLGQTSMFPPPSTTTQSGGQLPGASVPPGLLTQSVPSMAQSLSQLLSQPVNVPLPLASAAVTSTPMGLQQPTPSAAAAAAIVNAPPPAIVSAPPPAISPPPATAPARPPSVAVTAGSTAPTEPARAASTPAASAVAEDGGAAGLAAAASMLTGLRVRRRHAENGHRRAAPGGRDQTQERHKMPERHPLRGALPVRVHALARREKRVRTHAAQQWRVGQEVPLRLLEGGTLQRNQEIVLLLARHAGCVLL
jgi:hypothetical protein